MPTSCLGVQEEVHFGSVGRKVHVAPERSYRERERDRKMGSPRPSYSRVKGICEYQGLVGGSRWGPLLRGQTNHNSYSQGSLEHSVITSIC